MEKSKRVDLLIQATMGMVCFMIVLLTDTKIETFFIGVGTASFVQAAVMIAQAVYWNLPQNRERYREKIEEKKIRRKDELHKQIMYKSGWVAYLIGLCILLIGAQTFIFLDIYEVLEDGLLFSAVLLGLVLVQVLCGWLAYRRIQKKYE